MPPVRHLGLAVVFHGWELAACEAAGDGAHAADLPLAPATEPESQSGMR